MAAFIITGGRFESELLAAFNRNKWPFSSEYAIDDIPSEHRQTISNLREIFDTLRDISKNKEKQTASILRRYFDEFLQISIYEIEEINLEFLFNFDGFYDAVISILKGCLFDDPDEDNKGTQ